MSVLTSNVPARVMVYTCHSSQCESPHTANDSFFTPVLEFSREKNEERTEERKRKKTSTEAFESHFLSLFFLDNINVLSNSICFPV